MKRIVPKQGKLWSHLEQSPSNKDISAVLILWLASLFITLHGLGNASLAGDEIIVARIALEISRSDHWDILLQPTLWGEAYANKPPLIHTLIAIIIVLWRWLTGSPASQIPPEWVIRLGPATISSLIIPITTLTQKALLPGKPRVSYLSALVLLTTPPLITHAHVAMLDGMQLVGITALWLFLLLSVNQPANKNLWLILSGLTGSMLILLKPAAFVPIIITAIILLCLDARRPNAEEWKRIAALFSLGVLPGLSWHILKFAFFPSESLNLWWTEGFARPLGARADGLSEYSDSYFLIKELLKGGFTWIIPLFGGLIYSIKNLHFRWSKWVIVTSLCLALMALAPQPHHPHYSYLIWYPFALLSGAGLYLITEGKNVFGLTRLLTSSSWIVIALFCIAYNTISGIDASLTEGLQSYKVITQILPVPLIGGALLINQKTLNSRLAGVYLVGLGWIISLLFLLNTHNWKPWGGHTNVSSTFAQELRIKRHRHGAGQFPIAAPSLRALRWYLDENFIEPSLHKTNSPFILLTYDSDREEAGKLTQVFDCHLKDVLQPATYSRDAKGAKVKFYICGSEPFPANSGRPLP